MDSGPWKAATTSNAKTERKDENRQEQRATKPENEEVTHKMGKEGTTRASR